jgi:hypothetical protein
MVCEDTISHMHARQETPGKQISHLLLGNMASLAVSESEKLQEHGACEDNS